MGSLDWTQRDKKSPHKAVIQGGPNRHVWKFTVTLRTDTSRGMWLAEGTHQGRKFLMAVTATAAEGKALCDAEAVRIRDEIRTATNLARLAREARKGTTS